MARSNKNEKAHQNADGITLPELGEKRKRRRRQEDHERLNNGRSRDDVDWCKQGEKKEEQMGRREGKMVEGKRGFKNVTKGQDGKYNNNRSWKDNQND